jgi:hypothetical protein
MNCNIIPLTVRFHRLFLVEKHSNQVAFPPSFSVLIANSSSSTISSTRPSSKGTPFRLATTRRASSRLPVPSRCRLTIENSAPFDITDSLKLTAIQVRKIFRKGEQSPTTAGGRLVYATTPRSRDDVTQDQIRNSRKC